MAFPRGAEDLVFEALRVNQRGAWEPRLARGSCTASTALVELSASHGEVQRVPFARIATTVRCSIETLTTFITSPQNLSSYEADVRFNYIVDVSSDGDSALMHAAYGHHTTDYVLLHRVRQLPLAQGSQLNPLLAPFVGAKSVLVCAASSVEDDRIPVSWRYIRGCLTLAAFIVCEIDDRMEGSGEPSGGHSTVRLASSNNLSGLQCSSGGSGGVRLDVTYLQSYDGPFATWAGFTADNFCNSCCTKIHSIRSMCEMLQGVTSMNQLAHRPSPDRGRYFSMRSAGFTRPTTSGAPLVTASTNSVAGWYRTSGRGSSDARARGLLRVSRTISLSQRKVLLPLLQLHSMGGWKPVSVIHDCLVEEVAVPLKSQLTLRVSTRISCSIETLESLLANVWMTTQYDMFLDDLDVLNDGGGEMTTRQTYRASPDAHAPAVELRVVNAAVRLDRENARREGLSDSSDATLIVGSVDQPSATVGFPAPYAAVGSVHAMGFIATDEGVHGVLARRIVSVDIPHLNDLAKRFWSSEPESRKMALLRQLCEEIHASRGAAQSYHDAAVPQRRSPTEHCAADSFDRGSRHGGARWSTQAKAQSAPSRIADDSEDREELAASTISMEEFSMHSFVEYLDELETNPSYSVIDDGEPSPPVPASAIMRHEICIAPLPGTDVREVLDAEDDTDESMVTEGDVAGAAAEHDDSSSFSSMESIIHAVGRTAESGGAGLVMLSSGGARTSSPREELIADDEFEGSECAVESEAQPVHAMASLPFQTRVPDGPHHEETGRTLDRSAILPRRLPRQEQPYAVCGVGEAKPGDLALPQKRAVTAEQQPMRRGKQRLGNETVGPCLDRRPVSNGNNQCLLSDARDRSASPVVAVDQALYDGQASRLSGVAVGEDSPEAPAATPPTRTDMQGPPAVALIAKKASPSWRAASRYAMEPGKRYLHVLVEGCRRLPILRLAPKRKSRGWLMLTLETIVAKERTIPVRFGSRASIHEEVVLEVADDFESDALSLTAFSLAGKCPAKRLGKCVLSLKSVRPNGERRRLRVPLVHNAGRSSARERGIVVLTVWSENFGLARRLSREREVSLRQRLRRILKADARTELHRLEWLVGEYAERETDVPLLLQRLSRRTKEEGEAGLGNVVAVTVHEVRALATRRGTPATPGSCYVQIRSTNKLRETRVAPYRRLAVFNEVLHIPILAADANVVELSVFSGTFKYGECVVSLAGHDRSGTERRTLPIFHAAGTAHASLSGFVTVAVGGNGVLVSQPVEAMREEAFRVRLKYFMKKYTPEQLHKLDAVAASVGDMDAYLRSQVAKYGPEPTLRRATIHVKKCLGLGGSTPLGVAAEVGCSARIDGWPSQRYSASAASSSPTAAGVSLAALASYGAVAPSSKSQLVSAAGQQARMYIVVRAGLDQFHSHVVSAKVFEPVVLNAVFHVHVMDPDIDEVLILLMSEGPFHDVEVGRAGLSLRHLSARVETERDVQLISRAQTRMADFAGVAQMGITPRDFGVTQPPRTSAHEEEVLRRIGNLLYQYVPEQLHRLDYLLGYYAGRETDLVNKVIREYGPETGPARMTVRILGLRQFTSPGHTYVKGYVNGVPLLRTAVQPHGGGDFTLGEADRTEGVVELVDPRRTRVQFKVAQQKFLKSVPLAYVELSVLGMRRDVANVWWVPLYSVADGAPIGSLGVELQSAAFLEKHAPAEPNELDDVMRDVASLVRKYRPEEMFRVQPWIAQIPSLRDAHCELRRELAPYSVAATIFVQIERLDMDDTHDREAVLRRRVSVTASLGIESARSVPTTTLSDDGAALPLLRIDIPDLPSPSQSAVSLRRVNGLEITVCEYVAPPRRAAGSRVRKPVKERELGRALVSLRALLTPELYDAEELVAVPLVTTVHPRRGPKAHVGGHQPRASPYRKVGTATVRVILPAFEKVPRWLRFDREKMERVYRPFIRYYSQRIGCALEATDPLALMEFHYTLHERDVASGRWPVSLVDWLETETARLGAEPGRIGAPPSLPFGVGRDQVGGAGLAWAAPCREKPSAAHAASLPTRNGHPAQEPQHARRPNVRSRTEPGRRHPSAVCESGRTRDVVRSAFDEPHIASKATGVSPASGANGVSSSSRPAMATKYAGGSDGSDSAGATATPSSHLPSTGMTSAAEAKLSHSDESLARYASAPPPYLQSLPGSPTRPTVMVSTNSAHVVAAPTTDDNVRLSASGGLPHGNGGAVVSEALTESRDVLPHRRFPLRKSRADELAPAQHRSVTYTIGTSRRRNESRPPQPTATADLVAYRLLRPLDY